MLFNRESGLLVHPTSLPGPYGVGDLGAEAYRFIDQLVEAEQTLWQVLPLTPPGNAGSPYQCTSSFAGDVLLLSLDTLAAEGLLQPLEESAIERARLPHGPYDFAVVAARKLPFLRHAAAQFLQSADAAKLAEFEAFRCRNSYWLTDYARFEALRRRSNAQPWWKWPEPLRSRDLAALRSVDQELHAAIELEQVLQFFFEQQWGTLRAYANKAGIRVVGDLPIFVAHDSADVWANQELFCLDSEGQATVVAGVPPDYFSKDGQRWGNPLFEWPAHEASEFRWWRSRVKRTLEMADILRIDHFRGLAACWEIQGSEPTAVKGRWVPAPGDKLLSWLQKDIGLPLPIIAEDLGIITDDVVALREKFGLATMRILQFSFNGKEEFLPRHYPENCVAFTGTHDNDTTAGWYKSDASKHQQMSVEEVERERDQVRRYFSTDGTDIEWTCMRALLAEKPCAVIFPIQDLMGLGSEARMNTPGSVGSHNWSWRFEWAQLKPHMIDGLAHITREGGRARSALKRGIGSNR